jgi:hypothetical protein
MVFCPLFAFKNEHVGGVAAIGSAGRRRPMATP